jgi:hypothetical protein
MFSSAPVQAAASSEISRVAAAASGASPRRLSGPWAGDRNPESAHGLVRGTDPSFPLASNKAIDTSAFRMTIHNTRQQQAHVANLLRHGIHLIRIISCS